MRIGEMASPNHRVVAYLGVGSNLDGPVGQVRSACRELGTLPESQCLQTSNLYQSTPLGPAEQPDFVNAVAVLATGLPVETLLEILQDMEAAHGRRRRRTKWGPRPLDLDILLYGDMRMNTPHLVLPHPGLHKRSFVLYPLLDVSTPALHIPGHGCLGKLVNQCPKHDIRRL